MAAAGCSYLMPAGSVGLGCRSENPSIVPHPLPTEEQWQQLAADLPLQLVSYQDTADMYLALLQVGSQYRGDVKAWESKDLGEQCAAATLAAAAAAGIAALICCASRPC